MVTSLRIQLTYPQTWLTLVMLGTLWTESIRHFRGIECTPGGMIHTVHELWFTSNGLPCGRIIDGNCLPDSSQYYHSPYRGLALQAPCLYVLVSTTLLLLRGVTHPILIHKWVCLTFPFSLNYYSPDFQPLTQVFGKNCRRVRVYDNGVNFLLQVKSLFPIQ